MMEEGKVDEEFNLYSFEAKIRNKFDSLGRRIIDCLKLDSFRNREMSVERGEITMELISCGEDSDYIILSGLMKVINNDYWNDQMKSEGKEIIVENKIRELYLDGRSWRIEVILNTINKPNTTSLRSFTSLGKLGDRKFYDKLYQECFCNEVGEAFFHYIHTIDTVGFNPQAFPITQSKKDSLSKRLDNVYKFLKDEYILKKLDIDVSAQDLYQEFKYQSYNNKLSKEDFHRKMTEAGFNRIKKDNKLWYEIKHKNLLKVANNKLWLHELDEFEEETEEQEEEVLKPKKKVSSKYDNKYSIDFQDI